MKFTSKKVKESNTLNDEFDSCIILPDLAQETVNNTESNSQEPTDLPSQSTVLVDKVKRKKGKIFAQQVYLCISYIFNIAYRQI